MERISVSEECFEDAHSKIGLLVSSIKEDSFLFKLDKDVNAWPGISGIDGSNYFTVLDRINRDSSIKIINQMSHISLPSIIMDHMSSLGQESNFYTNSGFFAQFNKAYIIIENVLYIWSFSSSSNLIRFDQEQQLILDVCLIEKPEELFAFPDHSHILLISTPTHLQCYAVQIMRNDGLQREDFEFLINPSVIFSLQTSGIEGFTKFEDSRIFCRKYDGEICEMLLKLKNGHLINVIEKNLTASLFSKVFPTMSHIIFGIDENRIASLFTDSYRNLLYAITKWNAIKVFYLGLDSRQFKPLVCIKYQEIFQNIKKVYNKFTSDDLGEFTNHSIISPDKSSNISLIIFTSTAVRLYFKFCVKTMRLNLHHARFPPIYQQLRTSKLMKAVNLDDTCLFFMDDPINHEKPYNARVFATSDSLFDPQSPFNEVHQLCDPYSSSYSNRIWSTLQLNPNEIIILKDNGLNFVSTKSKYEIFNELLNNYGVNSEEILSLIMMCSPVYLCILAIEMIAYQKQANELLLQFIDFNGRSKILSNTSQYLELNSILPTSLDLTMTRGTENQTLPFKSLIGMNLTQNQIDSQNNINAIKAIGNSFSIILASIFTFSASILLPLWQKKIFSISKLNSKKINANILNFTEESHSFEIISSKLRDFQNFLRDFSKYLFGHSSEEFQNVMNLMIINEISLEMLALLQIIIRNGYELHLFIPEKYWRILQNETFASFIKNYKSHSALIIESLLMYFLENDTNVEELNQSLSKNCPQIYTEVDALFSKATQNLVLAQANPNQSHVFIEKAMTIYRSILAYLKLKQASFNLLNCQAFTEIAQLCIKRITMPKSSSEEKQEAIQIFCETLNFLKSIIDKQTIDESIAKNFLNYSHEKAINDFDSMLKLGLSSDLPELHYQIFHTLLQVKDYELLIKINSPYIDNFIAKIVNEINDSDNELNEQKLKLAWKFYESRSMFFSAAKLLFKSIDDGSNLDLNQRFEIINKVLLLLKCIKPSRITNEIEEFLTIVENCKISCNIQLKIYKRLLQVNASKDAIDSMQSKLFKLEDLLIKFVHPYDLLDCKLYIIASSNNEIPRDAILAVWNLFIVQELYNYAHLNGNLTLLMDTIAHFKNNRRIFLFNAIIESILIESENQNIPPYDVFLSLMHKANLDPNALLESLHHCLASNLMSIETIASAIIAIIKYDSNNALLLNTVVLKQCIEYVENYHNENQKEESNTDGDLNQRMTNPIRELLKIVQN